MNNEIKEILDKLNNINNYDYSETCDNKNNVIEKEYDIYLSKKETDLLLDYITNLQQENERIKKMNMYEHKYGSDMEEKYLIEKTKNDRAIEYIEHNTFQDSDGGWTFTFYKGKEILLDILNGRSDE